MRTCAFAAQLLASVAALALTTAPTSAQTLLGHWPLDGNAIDSSPFGNDGFIYGGVIPTEDRFGTLFGALYFDGVDGFIDLGNDSSLQASLPLTIAAWIKIEEDTSGGLFDNNYTENDYTGAWVIVNSQSFSVGFGSGGCTCPAARTSLGVQHTLQPGVWAHLAVVCGLPGQMRIYLNGCDLGGTISGTGGPLLYNGSSPGNIGRFDSSTQAPPVYFKGAIDDLRYYAGALTPAEIGVLADSVAKETIRLGSPPNPWALVSGTTGGPVVGSTWAPQIDHTTFVPTALLDVVFVGAQPDSVPLPPAGTLLVDIAIVPPLVFTATPGQPFMIQIPANCSLVGQTLYSQGLSLDAGGTIELTNAIDILFGTY